MKALKMMFKTTTISTISTYKLRNNFPNVYRDLVKRKLIGNGNIIFTRDIKYISGEMVSEPYLILTNSNMVLEIKEYGTHYYLNIIGKEQVGKTLRREFDLVRHGSNNPFRRQTKQTTDKHTLVLEAKQIKYQATRSHAA